MYNLCMLTQNFKKEKGSLGSRLWEWSFGSGATVQEVTWHFQSPWQQTHVVINENVNQPHRLGWKAVHRFVTISTWDTQLVCLQAGPSMSAFIAGPLYKVEGLTPIENCSSLQGGCCSLWFIKIVPPFPFLPSPSLQLLYFQIRNFPLPPETTNNIFINCRRNLCN